MSAFPTASTTVRGFTQTFTHINPGGRGPLLLVHGWPETRRIWWRMLQPLADAGYEVICPDLRGFGDSDVSPDGIHDVPIWPVHASPQACALEPWRNHAR